MPLRLVVVARLSAQKGLFLMLEALAQVRDRGIDVQVNIIGDGPERSELAQKIVELNLVDRVSLVGALGGEGVRRSLADCHGMLLPSFAEGLPVVLMEAMAIGRPVITTAINGIPELVTHGESGWLVPAGDVGALADAIEEFSRTSMQNLAIMGQSGREAVLRCHDIDREAAKLSVLMKSEIGSS
jgi:glycosyltransferase involved in cell wall biosynthesis